MNVSADVQLAVGEAVSAASLDYVLASHRDRVDGIVAAVLAVLAANETLTSGGRSKPDPGSVAPPSTDELRDEVAEAIHAANHIAVVRRPACSYCEAVADAVLSVPLLQRDRATAAAVDAYKPQQEDLPMPIGAMNGAVNRAFARLRYDWGHGRVVDTAEERL